METGDGHHLRSLQDLVPLLQQADGFAEIVAVLKKGQSGTIDGAWGSSRALAAAAIARESSHPVVIVLPRLSDVDDFAVDLAGFLGRDPLVFPAWETLPDEQSVADAVFGGRLRALQELDAAIEGGGVLEATTGRDGEDSTGTSNRSDVANAPADVASVPKPKATVRRKKAPSKSTDAAHSSSADSKLASDTRETNSSSAPAVSTASPPPNHDHRPVIVTSLPALMQPVPSRAERERGTRTLRVGTELDVDEFLRWLVERGFQRVPAIEAPGEFCMHGGILDVFSPDSVDPLRIELFGEEIESIRRFDVETQRKVSDHREVRLTVVGTGAVDGPRSKAEGTDREPSSGPRKRGKAPFPAGGSAANDSDASPTTVPSLPITSRDGTSFLDALSPHAWIVLSELQELRDEGQQFRSRLDDPRGLFNPPAVLEHCTRFPTVVLATLTADGYEQHCHLAVESIERLAGPRAEAMTELATVVGKEERLLVACHNDGERTRLAELFAQAPAPIGKSVTLCVGFVARGFRLVRDRIVVLSDHELFGRTEVRRTTSSKRRHESRAIDTFLDLNEGDLVVHLSHGIGRYRGMQLMTTDGQAEEHLLLEFRDAVRIFVPVSLIHLVQKYVGPTKVSPELSKVGGTSWSKKKQQVAGAVADLASDMIQLQAARAAKPGMACPPDSQYMKEFDAAFPYTETPDQVVAIRDVKGDMELPRPMDRLICGDVGFGKTEVAMRGAFKAIDAGRQVAILVPTTVLAEQHYRTFSERMAEFPVRVDVISRFRTKGEQKKILKALEDGEIDVVVGTHRLVQKDVKFKDLGLVIIDEEQRFGVEAKDMLKQLRLEVDVLTLTATPIPRTLHLSILGIRDISNLTTPPQDRQAIETRLSRFDPQLIRNAVMREMNRGGQIYFVHNRVHDIHEIEDRLQKIVPEARIVVGHGQMSGDELEAAMYEFVAHKADILIATTIIESGLDIPNANTMFIHRADIYGLADLHQLRGRVGRHKHRAYCYLLLEEGRMVNPQAARRLKAIEEFSELGAGFRIAMRDLEIRGAGNILGTEQSGHIASVGYELYCQLLENAVRAQKKQPLREHRHVQVELLLSAYFPGTWVPPGRHKIETYRKLSSCESVAELADFRAELVDRFGPMPPEAARLLDIQELQALARGWQIDEIRLQEGFVALGYRRLERIRQLQQKLGTRLRIVDGRWAYLVSSVDLDDGVAVLADLKMVLQ